MLCHRRGFIEDICYFTALANWNFSKVQRHKVLLQAQRAKGVKVVYRMFKKVDRTCRLCHLNTRLMKKR